MCEDALWYVVELDFAIPVNFDQGKITLLKSLAVQKQLCAYLILLKKKLQKKLKSSLDNKYELNNFVHDVHWNTTPYTNTHNSNYKKIEKLNT